MYWGNLTLEMDLNYVIHLGAGQLCSVSKTSICQSIASAKVEMPDQKQTFMSF